MSMSWRKYPVVNLSGTEHYPVGETRFSDDVGKERAQF